MTPPATRLDPAVEALIRRNVGLVHAAARTLRPPHPYDHDDLVDVGLQALVRQARAYDPRRGVAFRAFAYPVIRLRMIDWCRANTWAYSRKHGYRAEVYSLSAPTADGEHEIGAALPARADDRSAEDRRALLALLPPRERFIVLAREAGYQVWEIALLLGVTESRVSQLNTHAAGRIRRAHREAA